MDKESNEFEDLTPSKSQRKREMQAFRDMAEQLTQLSAEQLSGLPMPEIVEAVEEAKRITKGNARKRQVQLIAKRLSRTDTTAAQTLLDELDASSVAHVQKFHRLETWREQLLSNDPDVMSEIMSEYPELDRQHLRQLVRAAIREQDKRENENSDTRTEYRKLFQYLKSLSD